MVVAVTGRAGYTTDHQHDEISSYRVFAILILCEADGDGEHGEHGDGGGGEHDDGGEADDGSGGEHDVAGHGRDDVCGGGRPLQPRLQCESSKSMQSVFNLAPHQQDAEDPAMKWRLVFTMRRM